MPKYPTCLYCGRGLTDPLSIKQGFGPECARNLRTQQGFIDTARGAMTSGFDDTKLRVIALVLKRREGALLLLTDDDTATEMQVSLIRAIRREMEARVKLLIRKGYLPPIEIYHELADKQVSAKGGVAHTTHFIGC